MLQSLDILKKLLELRRKVLKPRDFRGRLNYLQRHRREKGKGLADEMKQVYCPKTAS